MNTKTDLKKTAYLKFDFSYVSIRSFIFLRVQTHTMQTHSDGQTKVIIKQKRVWD